MGVGDPASSKDDILNNSSIIRDARDSIGNLSEHLLCGC